MLGSLQKKYFKCYTLTVIGEYNVEGDVGKRHSLLMFGVPSSHKGQFGFIYFYFLGFPGGSDGKESACNAGDPDSIPGSDPWVGRIPWRRNGYTQSSILAWRSPWTEEPGGHDHGVVTQKPNTTEWLPLSLSHRGAWWPSVSGVAESRTWLKGLSAHTRNIQDLLRYTNICFIYIYLQIHKIYKYLQILNIRYINILT